MDQVTSEPPQAAPVEFVHRMVRIWQAALGADLLGAYLIGSLAHGGFSRRYSDVDVALVTESGLSPQKLDLLRSEAVALSADWAPKLSVFWTDRHFSLGRFPPLDRVDYLDNAVVLMERERVRPARPTLTEVRRYLAGEPFKNWSNSVRRFVNAETLEAKDRKVYLRSILYAARFCYSWTTGQMGSNDEAVAYVERQHAARLDVDLIARALECRQADADPDFLFSERTKLPFQVEVCAALLGELPPAC
jgi:predicted nucleotidyltransferase